LRKRSFERYRLGLFAPSAYESGRALAFSIVKWPH
jgi:hypothetical protein